MSDDYFRWTEELFDPARIFEKPEALSRYRVLDISHIIIGPAIADYLGEMGAEVIKVELPGVGDATMRSVPTYGIFWKNNCPAQFAQNRNKYYITVDWRKPEGKELFFRLLQKYRCSRPLPP